MTRITKRFNKISMENCNNEQRITARTTSSWARKACTGPQEKLTSVAAWRGIVLDFSFKIGCRTGVASTPSLISFFAQKGVEFWREVQGIAAGMQSEYARTGDAAHHPSLSAMATAANSCPPSPPAADAASPSLLKPVRLQRISALRYSR